MDVLDDPVLLYYVEQSSPYASLLNCLLFPFLYITT